MARRLELPDELVLADGTSIHSPQELAAQLETDPCLPEELQEYLVDGHLELWLRKTGWAALPMGPPASI